MATRQIFSSRTGLPLMRTVLASTRSNGFLEQSQVNQIPEKVEYLPDKLGYMDTQFSKPIIILSPDTFFTTISSWMMLVRIPKVTGPAGMQQSARKLPLFMNAQSALVQCLYKETRNYKYAFCSFLIFLNRKSTSYLNMHAMLYCFSWNLLQISWMQAWSQGSCSILAFSWFTSTSVRRTAMLLLLKIYFSSQGACSPFSSRSLLLTWNIQMRLKFLKLVPLFTSMELLIFSCTTRWSWPPRMRSISENLWAKFTSLYFIMWVSAIMRLHFYDFSCFIMQSVYYQQGVQSQNSLYSGMRVSIHYFSAKLNMPIRNPPFSMTRYYSQSARRFPVRLSWTLLSIQGKLVLFNSYLTCSMGQSRSWLPRHARSILKEFRGLIMFQPLCSEDSRAGENTSPENRVNVDGSRQRSIKLLKPAAPAFGSVLEA